MKIELKCPRCSSMQKFTRLIEKQNTTYMILIRCSTCKWVKVLDSGSEEKMADKIKDIRKEQRLARKIRNR